MSFKLHIPDPCHENWDAMKMGSDSRFCKSCQKDVIDFTGKSREEILQIIFSARDQKVCGRFHKYQLDYPADELLVTIHALSKNPKNNNLAFYLLTMGTLLLSSCSCDETKNTAPSIEIVDDQKAKRDTMHKIFSKQEMEEVECVGEPVKNIVKKSADGKIEQIEITSEDIVVGMILPPEPEITPPDISKNEPYKFADVMPEFVGGIDSLHRYINKNLKYPAWELEQKILGTVYVRFIVDKTGKAKSPQILKSVPESKHFDEEVIKLINGMPLWKPGSHKGEKVDVEFVLPIKFKI